MLDSLRKDFFLKLFALAASLGLWLHVELLDAQNIKRGFTFTLNVTGLDTEHFAATELSPNQITLEAVGPPDEINKLKNGPYSAILDLEGAEEGLKEFPVRPIYPDAKVSWERPSRGISVNIEKVVIKTFNVEVERNDSLAPKGLTLSDVAVEPSMVMLSGPESEMNSVAQVIAVMAAEAPIKVGGTIRVPLEILDKASKVVKNVRSEPREVLLHPTFIAQVPRRSVLISPQWIGQPELGYRVTSFKIIPNQIELSGDFRVLANISDVRTRPIDITGLKENATINTTVIIPTAASSSARKVTVRIVIQADPSVNPNKPPIP